MTNALAYFAPLLVMNEFFYNIETCIAMKDVCMLMALPQSL
jgi:hypothetical protein